MYADKPSSKVHPFSATNQRSIQLALTGTILVALLWWLCASYPDRASGRQELQPHAFPLPTNHRLPVYSEYHHETLNYPQHDWQLSQPDLNVRYFYAADDSVGAGWGDAIEGLLLSGYIAYKAARSFVFSNRTLTDMVEGFSDGDRMPPSHIPYNAIIRGPVVGGLFPPGTNHPLAVHKVYYDKVCPKPVIYRPLNVHDRMSDHCARSAKVIADDWVAKLESSESRCIQSDPGSGPLLNHRTFCGGNFIRDIWQEFSKSPIITHFGWSPLIELAFDTNRKLFLSGPTYGPYLTQHPFTTNADRYTMIPGLLAIHVPREGSWAGQCAQLAEWSADYVAFNTFQELPDQFSPPLHEPGTNTADNYAIYSSHCYPSVERIVSKVHALRQTPTGQGLRKLFIMTDGSLEFVEELKSALWMDSDWADISSSLELILNAEQKYVADMVNMLVGQRAQVLIGNGFSTMTSTMVMMRMANGFPPDSTRFW